MEGIKPIRETSVTGNSEAAHEDAGARETVMGERSGVKKLLLLAAIVVAAASCQKEQEPVNDFVAGSTEPQSEEKPKSRCYAVLLHDLKGGILTESCIPIQEETTKTKDERTKGILFPNGYIKPENQDKPQPNAGQAMRTFGQAFKAQQTGLPKEGTNSGVEY